jgi:uncharacterized repeat protein (TIGR03803 family)
LPLSAALLLSVIATQLAQAQPQAVGTLWAFCAQGGCNCPYDAVPQLGLIQFDGNSYGATKFGGANDTGTVFKFMPSGVLTTLQPQRLFGWGRRRRVSPWRSGPPARNFAITATAALTTLRSAKCDDLNIHFRGSAVIE